MFMEVEMGCSTSLLSTFNWELLPFEVVGVVGVWGLHGQMSSHWRCLLAASWLQFQ